ncbi:unnamed protein product [Linum tenue]|uniref:Uncharacterized protein n=2 Tax=Linum tenue TaxID=586396 RepID=A0AAV0M1E8_9ROSI|nr:unnamed protein product [Linum tenue]
MTKHMSRRTGTASSSASTQMGTGRDRRQS